VLGEVGDGVGMLWFCACGAYTHKGFKLSRLLDACLIRFTCTQWLSSKQALEVLTRGFATTVPHDPGKVYRSPHTGWLSSRSDVLDPPE
jgi:hypothetical protein